MMLSACGRFSPQLFRKNVCKECFKADAAHSGRKSSVHDSPEKAKVETVVLSAHDTPVRAPRRSGLEALSPIHAGASTPGDDCTVCHGHVYLAEKVEVNGMKFHKKCFKCNTCSISLSTANCVGVGEHVFCRSHSKAAESALKNRRASRNYTPPAAKTESPGLRTARLSHSANSSPLAAPVKKPLCASYKPHAYRTNKCRDCLNDKEDHGVPLSHAGSSHSLGGSSHSLLGAHPHAPATSSSLHKATPAAAIASRTTSLTPSAAAAAGAPGASTAILDSKHCGVCTKAVYMMDKLETDGKVFHKWCFRCAECNKALNAGNYAGLHGRVYCKPHFKALFKLKGNYDEGFGHQQHKHNWSSRNASEEVGGAPESPVVSADRPPARAIHTMPISPVIAPTAATAAAAAPTPVAQTPAKARHTFNAAAPLSTSRASSRDSLAGSGTASRTASKESLGTRSTSKESVASRATPSSSSERVHLATPATAARRKSASSPHLGVSPATSPATEHIGLRSTAKGTVGATPRVASTGALRTTPSPKPSAARPPLSTARQPFTPAATTVRRQSSDA